MLEQPANGKQESALAGGRLEERWRKLQVWGIGHCQGFRAGHTFVLAPLAPIEELVDGEAESLLPQKQLLVTVEHFGTQLADESGSQPSYTYDFSCIPAEVPFRPARKERPVVRGLQSGVVIGPGKSGASAKKPAKKTRPDAGGGRGDR